MIDFGLGQLDRVGLIEYWIANEKEAGYCGKYLFVFDGQQCPAHSHRPKHETFFLVRGCLQVVMDGRSLTSSRVRFCRSRLATSTLSGADGNSLLLEFSMPCGVNDNCFEDPHIMEWLRRLS